MATAAEAGAADPEILGRQLAVLYEVATALAASSNDAEALTDAWRAAETLLGAAPKTAPGVSAGVDGVDRRSGGAPVSEVGS
ncbi:hypothetical protein [Streptomyces griseorubiginosus]|uniref:hypothetical protein n=1 Tax=Streptomyces griseorubiginosus TaxID=67304 RepID=UPI00368A0549